MRFVAIPGPGTRQCFEESRDHSRWDASHVPLTAPQTMKTQLRPLNSSHPMNPYHTASSRSPITHRHIPATRHRFRIRPPRTPLRCLLRNRRHTGLDIRVLLDHVVFVTVARQRRKYMSVRMREDVWWMLTREQRCMLRLCL
jgi:hypothetical protein